LKGSLVAFLPAERARWNGARSMRAGKGSLGHSSGDKYCESKGARSMAAGKSFSLPCLDGHRNGEEHRIWKRAMKTTPATSLNVGTDEELVQASFGSSRLPRQSCVTVHGHAQWDTI